MYLNFPQFLSKKDTIMKKTYISPNMEVIKVMTTQMLAGSLGNQSTPTVSFGSVSSGDDDDYAD